MKAIDFFRIRFNISNDFSLVSLSMNMIIIYIIYSEFFYNISFIFDFLNFS